MNENRDKFTEKRILAKPGQEFHLRLQQLLTLLAEIKIQATEDVSAIKMHKSVIIVLFDELRPYFGNYEVKIVPHYTFIITKPIGLFWNRNQQKYVAVADNYSPMLYHLREIEMHLRCVMRENNLMLPEQEKKVSIR